MKKSLNKSKHDLEEKVAELQLKEKESRANALRFDRWKESNFIGIIQSAEDGEIFEANDTVLNMLGYSRQELLNGQLDWAKITPPEYLYLDEMAIQEANEKGYWTPFEKEYLHKDGRRVPILIGGSLVQENGREYIVFIVDLTERKRAEEALRYSEQRFRQLAENINEVFWLGSPDWKKVLYVSPAYEKNWGLSPDALFRNSQGWFGDIYPADRKQVVADIPADTDGIGACVDFKEYRIRKADGQLCWVKTRAYPIFDRQGKVFRIAGITEDITERKQADTAQRRTNLSLRALIAVNEILIRAKDESELLKQVCRVITEVSGYRLAWVGFKEHSESKSVRPVAQMGYEEGFLDAQELTWDDSKWGQGPTGTAIRTGKPCIVRYATDHPRYELWKESALIRGFRASIALPLNDKEQTLGALSIYADGEDAFDEDEARFLYKLADELAFGIATLRSQEQHHKLHKQLQQAQKMEAIGQLTGGIAHDFNNTLASILGFTNLALQRFVMDDQPELREYLTEVVQAGERARDLVSQLLTFSRTKSSEASHLLLPPMIQEVSKLLQATLPSSIQLSSQIDKDVPPLTMDPVNFQQVLMNICINARDAIGDKGSILIRACPVNIISNRQLAAYTVSKESVLRNACDACHCEIEVGEYVELSVQDTGTGIGAEELKRMFEPFFTTKDIGKGSGMGLSMVHGIIHQQGGHILVDTQLGKGTMFRMLLPAAKELSSHSPAIEMKVVPTCQGLDNARILIVDDEQSVARFIGDLLDSRGGKVTVMTDSSTALDLFSQDPTAFDLIITDQTMPGLTGVDLARELLSQRPDLPIILCTGYSEYVNEENAKAIGIRGYLTKPMAVGELYNLVVNLLH